MPDRLPAPPCAADGPAADAERWSIFLDFDGTLVELAERHDAVVVQAPVRRLLAALARRLDGRLAVVSGRPADDIAAYLHAEDCQPPFAIAGSHGQELRWTDGRRESPPRPAALDAALTAFHALAVTRPGVVVEEKPLGVALHYRQAPDAGPACCELAEAVAARTGFSVQHGKMVCELRAHGADKGDAVRRFLSEPPMAGTRPLFVGDDLTDEAGFAAAEHLGGAGIFVGDAAGRRTTARYGLPSVSAVHEWLGRMAGVFLGERA